MGITAIAEVLGPACPRRLVCRNPIIAKVALSGRDRSATLPLKANRNDTSEIAFVQVVGSESFSRALKTADTKYLSCYAAVAAQGGFDMGLTTTASGTAPVGSFANS